MSGGRGTMRAGPARRDPDFRGIDTEALGHLIKQIKDASSAIKGWLNGNPLPPEVPRTGVRMATEVDLWASVQLGMLIRRRNYALTHPDHVHDLPAAGTPGLGTGKGGGGTGSTGGGAAGNPELGVTAPGTRPPRHTTPSGAGPDLGNFPTQQAAAKAAATDVLAVKRSAKDHAAVPASVWRQLTANADDPDYTAAIYTKLGPAGTADLIVAAGRDQERLKVIAESLGTASRHFALDEKWLRRLLAEAGIQHRAEVIQVLDNAHLSAKAEAALDRLRQLDVRPVEAAQAAEKVPAGSYLVLDADDRPPRAG